MTILVGGKFPGFAAPHALRAGTHGDSICDLGLAGGSGVNLDITTNGIWGWADAFSGGRINWIWKGGIGGQTSAQIATAARIAATIAQNLDICVEDGGTNDLASGVLAPVIFANRRKVWAALTAAGVTVFAMTLPPRNDLSAAAKRELQRLNTMIRIAAQQTKGVVLFDVARLVTHPDTGDYLASGQYGAIDTMNNWSLSDTTHLGATGGAYAGYELARLIREIAPGMSWALPQGGTTDIDYAWDGAAIVPEGNIAKNGKLSGAAGNLNGRAAVGQPLTVGSQLATSWKAGGSTAIAVPAGAAANSIALTKVQKANPEVSGFGDWQQITIPAGNAGANGVCTIYQDIAMTNVAVGDRIAAACQLETDAAGWLGDGTCYNNVSLFLTVFNSSFATIATSRCFPTNSGNGRFRHRTPDGSPVILRTPLITLPAGTFAITLSARFDGVGTIRLGDMQCRRELVPPLQAATA